jgi:hypothetical protein
VGEKSAAVFGLFLDELNRMFRLSIPFVGLKIAILMNTLNVEDI